MLNEETNKGEIIAAIRCGDSDDEIRELFNIGSGTLDNIKNVYEKIERQLKELKPVTEIARELQCSDEFVQQVQHIIITDVETLIKEAQEAPDEPEEDHNQNPQEGDRTQKPSSTPPDKKQTPRVPRDMNKTLKKTAEAQTASVLVNDAGDIGKDVAIKRQEIGKFVTETMATAAMQYGFTDFIDWLQVLFDFFVNNYGRMQEKDEQIAEITEINQQLRAELQRNIIRIHINRCLDHAVTASLLGGGTLDFETLEAYQRLLESTNPELLIAGGVEVYAT